MARTHSADDNTFFCPVCHAELPKTAKVCPECGSDEETGWKDSFEHIGDEDDFDYNDFVNREGLGKQKGAKPKGVGTGTWLLTLVLLAIFIFYALRSLL